MAAIKNNLGKMPCEACGDIVAVFESGNGTLSYKCQDAQCEHSAFAQGHTGAAKRWRAKLGTAPKAPEKQEPKPAEKQPPKAPEKPAKSAGGFSLSNL